MAVARRRWILPVGIAAVVLFFALPLTQDYAARLLAGLTNQDLATQMRFGEYKDAFILIERYPLIGVGFAGVPERDIYLGVSSLYLTIAEETGLIGLALFAFSLLEAFRYGLSRWRMLRGIPPIFDVWFGLTPAVFGALISGIFDHFYFDLTFNGAALMFWLTVALMLAAARLSDDMISGPATPFGT
jgi:O-antigen ligase